MTWRSPARGASPHGRSWSITAAVATWVAGFDIFYALPDEAFDRKAGLRSAVVRLGVPRSVLLAKPCTASRSPRWRSSGRVRASAGWYFVGVVAAAGILAYEHQLVRPDDISRLDPAFFTMNAVMSVTVFAFALLDRLL